MVHFVLARTLYLVGVEKLRDLIIAGNEILVEHGMSSCGVLHYLSELSTLDSCPGRERQIARKIPPHFLNKNNRKPTISTLM